MDESALNNDVPGINNHESRDASAEGMGGNYQNSKHISSAIVEILYERQTHRLHTSLVFQKSRRCNYTISLHFARHVSKRV